MSSQLFCNTNTTSTDRSAITNGHSNGHSNGHANEHTNGHTTNGYTTNGHQTNGHHINGHNMNGHHTNGHNNHHLVNNGHLNGDDDNIVISNGQNNGHQHKHQHHHSYSNHHHQHHNLRSKLSTDAGCNGKETKSNAAAASDTILSSEGYTFLQEAVELILNEAIAKGIDRNSKVVEFVSPSTLEKQLDLDLQDDAMSRSDLLATCREVIKFSVKSGHPHFFNQLFGGLDPYGLAGSWISDALNTSQYTYEVAPVFTVMERALFAEMRRLAGFEQGDGIFCPGGSISNIYAINLARYQKFPDVKTKGLWGLPRMCIMTSQKAHYSLKKGAALLGIGMDNVLEVAADKQGRMIPLELDNALTEAKNKGLVPIMVNATAGTTVLGAYDPLVAISEVCRKHAVWMHVDAAWGGGVLLSENLRHKMDGVQHADSLTWNPHKMMGAPLQAAVFLTRHQNLLTECHSAKAKYLFQQDKFYDVSYDTGDKAVQCGRKVDVLKVWLMWKAKGSLRQAQDIEKLFHCARYLTKKISSKAGFRLVLSQPECTNVCFWYIPPRLRGQEETQEWWEQIGKVAPKIKERMVKQGTLLIGYQPDGDMVNFFRVVLSNMAITNDDMDFIVDEIDQLGQDL